MGYVQQLRQSVGPHPLIVVGAAAIVRQAQQLLLVKRTDNQLWGLPAGSKELDEPLNETVLRELHEETGLTGQKPQLLFIASGQGMQYTYPNGDQIDSVTAVYTVSAHGQVRGSLETSQVKFFAIKQLPQQLTPLTRRILTQLDF